MPECWLEREHGCCCQCKYRLRALGYKNNRQRNVGWACIALAFCEGEDIAYIGNFEHGMCELFMPKEG